jgi:hypothetical protein
VVGAAVVLIIVPLAAILALHLPPVQKQVIGGVVGRIERATVLSIQLESFRWLPFSGLWVNDLKLRSAGREVLDCGQAQISYSLSWNWPYFVPKELILDSPVIRLEKDSKGQWQLPLPHRPAESAMAMHESTREAVGGTASEETRTKAQDTARWLSFPWPPVRVKSGVITAEQDGRSILNIRDVSGTLSFQPVSGPDGPSLKVKLGDWGGRAELPQWGEWSISGDLSVWPEAISVESLVAAVGDGGGEAQAGRVALEGQWALQPPYDGNVRANLQSVRPAAFPELGGRLPQLQEISGLLDLRREAGAWSVAHDLQTNLGSFKGLLKSEKPPSDSRGSAQWALEFSDFRASEVLPVSDALFSGQMEVSVEGDSLREMTAQLDGRLGPSRVGEVTIKSGDIKAAYEKGKLILKTAGVESSMGAFSLSGMADLEGLWNEKHSGELKADIEVEKGNVEKLVSGRVGELAGTARLEARHGPGDMKDWEKWQAKLESKVTVPDLLSLKATGEYKAAALDLEYDLEAKDLSKVALVLPTWQGKGRLASKGKVKGRWPDLVWEGTVNSPELEYGSVRSEQASLAGKGSVLGIKGDRKLVFKTQGLSVDGKKVGSVQLDVEQHEDGCRYKIRGEQPWNRFTAALAGRIDNLEASPRQIAVSEGRISWNEQAGSVEGKFEVNEDSIRVHSFSLQQGAQKVRGAGTIVRDGGSDLKMNFEGLKAGQWLGLVGLENVVTGTISGEAQLAGRADQPEMSVVVQLSDGGLQIKQKRDVKGRKQVVTIKEPLGTVRLKGQYAKEALSFQGELLTRAEQKPIQFSARVPLRLTLMPFSLAALKNVDWASSWKLTDVRGEQIQPYIPIITRAGGSFFAEGRGSGVLGQPVIRTDGVWKDGSFVPTEWPHPVENAQVEFWADEKNIYVTKSDMKHLGGHVSITGKIDYPHFDVMEWEAVGEDLEFPEIYGIEGKVACKVRLVQNLEKADLTGELRFSKAKLNLGEFQSDLERNIQIVEGDSKGDVVEIGGDEMEQRSYYNRLKMSLALKLPASGTWVRGKGLEAEIIGDLRMEKEVREPLRFVGGFQTIRGTYTFQGNKLDIVSGELVFSGRPHADPNLKIVCQKVVRDASIQVQVTGPLSQPKMVLSSIPAMNQVDVLSYLLFGHPATELGAKESNQLQNSAASWLGSQTSGVIKGMFGESRFAPDTLTYRGSTTRKEGTTATSSQGGVIEIGKHITPDLSVTYGQGVMGETEKQVQVEYRINRHLSIQTQVGSEEQSGVDVFWRYDFGK